jgi:hypothetical protein
MNAAKFMTYVKLLQVQDIKNVPTLVARFGNISLVLDF